MLWNLDRQFEAANGPEASLGALAKVLPPGLIQEALDAREKSDQRIRKLPLPVVMWLVVGMSLYRNLNIQNVLRRKGRVCRREVRVKMSKYKKKRAKAA